MSEHLDKSAFRDSLDGYIRRIRESRGKLMTSHVVPDDVFDVLPEAKAQKLIAEETSRLQERIEHLKGKAKLVVFEFLKRTNLNIPVSVSEANGKLFVLGNCPACGQQINLANCIIWSEKRLGLRCSKCGATRWVT